MVTNRQYIIYVSLTFPTAENASLMTIAALPIASVC